MNQVFTHIKNASANILKGFHGEGKLPANLKKRFSEVKLKEGAEEALKHVPKKFIRTLKDGCKIYDVDGTYVRDNIFCDFTEGGNNEAYPDFIPKGEYWIDKDMSVKDKIATIIHEVIEREEMRKKGVDYEVGHEKANKAESKFRKTGKKPVEVQ